ncbi:cyclase family protein [Tautonia plasticadhaerens]|uniref:Cyclase n=1 Tax=Tautonia plasticadhaerens TaxID=2527974 RepID=A0A518GZP1_9BACT|nr:cyclase family protein [Tautonia plasticadhaerens]QDV34057.1 Putative cyclase [Tautonia plasticadhaerens]
MKWIRSFHPGRRAILAAALATLSGASAVPTTGGQDGPAAAGRADPPTLEGWTRGKGWGWIWGPKDEVGSLNAMSDRSRGEALRLASEGKSYDLGQAYSRRSFRWAGHNPGEVMTFRSPDRIAAMGDPDAPPPGTNPDRIHWHSCALFISDNVGTQIDGLGHVTAGADDHWYNGFTEADWGGDFGIRKCDATTIPPIIARGVMVDVAAWKGVDALPAHTVITAEDLQAALDRQGVAIRPGDVVLIRTGAGRYWGDEGADHETIAEHDSAGLDLAATRWLVEQQGAMMVGSDTSGFEVSPPPPGTGSMIPVHKYLLVDQGVHIGELHNLEALSRDEVFEFCYVASTNKIKGTTAGFALRPIALR